MPIARRLLPVVFTALVLSGCGNKTADPEEKVVRDSFDVALFVPDPDLNTLMLHAAWLGPESIAPVLKVLPSAATNDKKRVTLARFLEVLAWNGIRNQDSVKALSQMTKDKQPVIRLSAYYGLYASAVDLSKLDGYWDPSDPNHTMNPSKVAALHFADCRQLLLDRKLPLPAGPDGKVVGDPGRPRQDQPPISSAGLTLTRLWSKETDPQNRFFACIQAYRLGAADAVDPLIATLKPLPPPQKPTPAWEAAKARALRVLQEVNGRKLETWEEWQAWRSTSMHAPKTPISREPPK